jgi:tetratricopeptide (TPR) repeat protein
VIGNTLLDRYRLDEEIGRGGMGVVYRAHDTVLDRAVAVKVLPSSSPDRETLARWRTEAQAAAKLRHPHIVAVHDAGESNGSPFIVMELVEGAPLNRGETLSFADIVAIGRQLAGALAHAHANGIVHRDVKPANVLVQKNGGPHVKLADLGVARLAQSTQLTQEGDLIGTASYLAPEQAMGHGVDGRADLYSLGVLLYELSTGRLPFEGDDPLAVISQHLHAPVVPPRTYRSDVPPDLEAVILKLLAKDPERRFAGADELEEVLAGVSVETVVEGAAEEPTSDPVVLLDRLARGRMTGRTDQLHELRELWGRALKGTSHMALVSGEPGVGKTRLARELIVLAQLQGAAMLQGGCYEFEATTPYLPWVEGLRRWVDEADVETLRSVLGATAPELARLAPEIEAKVGPQPAAAALAPQQERLRMFDSFARFLRELAARRGLLVFLDDLHWADHGTLQLLHYVLRNLKDEKILVLGAYREVELDRAHPLSAALVEWNRERLVTRVPLGRLSLDGTERMLAAMFGQKTVSTEFAEAIHRETEGNPFFVEEVIKSLIEHGQIYRGGGRWQRKDVQDLTIPQSIKAAIGRRLNRLSEGTVTVLHTAAALGKVFDFDALAAVSGSDEDALLDALDEASTAQLVRVQAGEQFVFTHDKIREVLHEELNPIRQRRLHQRIAESLERFYGDAVDRHAQDLAYHFAHGSDLEKGLTYSLAAASHAEKVFAHDEALEHYERARECAEGLERLESLAEIEGGILDVHNARGETMLAAQHGERALALTKDPRRRAALRAKLGSTYVVVGDPRGREHLDAALAELDPATQRLEIAEAKMAVGRYEHLGGRHQSALTHQHQAREIAEASDDPALVAEIYSYIAGSYQHLALYEESMVWARKTIELADKHDMPALAALGHEFISEDSNVLGNFHEAERAALLNRALGERSGAMDRVGWATFVLTHIYCHLGDLDRAIEEGRRAVALARKLGETRLEVLSGAGLVMALLVRGHADADDVARSTLAVAEAAGTLYALVEARNATAAAHMRDGRWREALELLETNRSNIEKTDGQGVRMFVYPYLAEALLGLDKLDDAGKVLSEGIERSRRAGSRFFEAVGLRLSSRLHAARGDAKAARTVVDESLALAEAMEAPLQIARALAQRAGLREKEGDGKGAAADRQRAAEIFERCGAEPELTQLRAVQATSSSSAAGRP